MGHCVFWRSLNPPSDIKELVIRSFFRLKHIWGGNKGMGGGRSVQFYTTTITLYLNAFLALRSFSQQ